ncbi:DUF1801 domain-containing protein [Flagellimonas myxillae]|uniref:DUF1801 domain-containing protein n=1 Tax=Flagellimonas myxillae TaxID=2942214 RepID=UPI00201F6B63|nr:DUF1801 domain-containing protein [Muricauda myxillae]MCL6265917.1 DUF1801 domain-containing protein [Muricauda myxillae]
MTKLKVTTQPEFEAKLSAYPEGIRQKMEGLRNLVLETANEIATITKLEETLKWGEPSFVTPQGSTLRMDWKPKAPDQYAFYFQCSSRLVSTFKSIFNNQLGYESNRAIILPLESELPKEELKACIKAALTYHKVKHLPMLGI